MTQLLLVHIPIHSTAFSLIEICYYRLACCREEYGRKNFKHYEEIRFKFLPMQPCMCVNAFIHAFSTSSQIKKKNKKQSITFNYDIAMKHLLININVFKHIEAAFRAFSVRAMACWHSFFFETSKWLLLLRHFTRVSFLALQSIIELMQFARLKIGAAENRYFRDSDRFHFKWWNCVIIINTHIPFDVVVVNVKYQTITHICFKLPLFARFRTYAVISRNFFALTSSQIVRSFEQTDTGLEQKFFDR